MRGLKLACGIASLTLVAGCSSPAARHGSGSAALAADVAALGPRVEQREARRLAEVSHDTSLRLQRAYRVAGPALFQNFLVNTRIRKRGLCYQWTEDLLAELQRMDFATLELDWGVARAGTLREHNCVVVTAKGDPFERGLVLDPWRYGGRLFWDRVAADHYPWLRDNSHYARNRLRYLGRAPSNAAVKPR